MKPELIAQLVAALGPAAFAFITDLMTIWGKQSLTQDEVISFMELSQKSYDQYIADARAKINT